jgi:5-methylcytosine-specific restriction endonuclease McrBC regulatory subunit McrC
LRELGGKLARNRRVSPNQESDQSQGLQRSVIHVQQASNEECRIRVVDAVGVVATPSLIVDVSPKIPSQHLLYLLERAKLVPRMDHSRATLQASQTLFELVARWYLIELDRVLEEGLARDYRSERGESAAARGRVLTLPTARLYYGGHLGVFSEYQDFDFNTPLNRLLLHAARLLIGHPALPEDVRARARRASLRMDGIGPMQDRDPHAQPDRRTVYYGDAALLAKHLIDGVGRDLSVGGEPAWTFLIRTPEEVETGLRQALGEALPVPLTPVKRRVSLPGTDMALNPDLLFCELAVAEVKYKVAEPKWRREDLYELVAFATGLEVEHAAMIDFSVTSQPWLKTIQVGRVRVTHLTWPAHNGHPPSVALEQFTEQVMGWASGWGPS